MLNFMPFADVIWPALATPYFVPLFAPIIILLSLGAELAVMILRCRGVIPVKKIVVFGIGANLISWIIGAVSTTLLPLPNGLVPLPGTPVVTHGPLYWRIAMLGLIASLPMTILIEAAFYRLVQRNFRLEKFWSTVILANVASYAVVFCGMVWYFLA